MTDAPELSTAPLPQRLSLPRFPVLGTYVIIGVNALIYLADVALGGGVTVFGALVPILVLAYRQWWRLIAAGFLHADLMHIALNLYAFHSMGRLMERFFGLRRLLGIYGLSLFGSSVLVVLFSPLSTRTVGASGAIMGVLGALVVYFWKYRKALVGGQRFLSQLAQTALINIGIGLLPGISWWGHLGGFVAGALAGMALLPRYTRDAWTTPELALRTLESRNWLHVVLLAVGESALLGIAFWWRR